MPLARRTLAAADLAKDAVAQVEGGLRGEVVVGTMQSPGVRGLSIPHALVEFRADHPGVDVKVRHEGGSLKMVTDVREHRLDLALVAIPRSTRVGVELIPLFSEPMALVCAADHPLARRRRVRLAELAEEPFVELPRDWGTNMANSRAFAAANLERDIAFEVNDTGTVIEYVREGLGITLAPPSLVVAYDGLATVPVVGDPALFETFLATRPEEDQSAATKVLVETILRLAGA